MNIQPLITFIQQHLKSLAPIKMMTQIPKIIMMNCISPESMIFQISNLIKQLEEMIKHVYFDIEKMQKS